MKSPSGRGLAYNAQSGYLHEKGGLMAYMMRWPAGSFLIAFWKLDVAFAASPASIEEIALRWMHIVAAIIWLGFLFFFVLAVAPTLKALDPAVRAKVFPEIASRGLWWLRWSALVAWLAGFRYFMILAKTDAVTPGGPMRGARGSEFGWRAGSRRLPSRWRCSAREARWAIHLWRGR